VTKRYIEAGELVTSGVSSFSSGTPIVQIADLSRMLVRLTVNEVDVYKIRADQPVEIRIDGAKGELFHGRVSKVAPAAVDAAGAAQGGGGGWSEGQGVVRFAVEIVVDRPDPRLRPGMTAKCTVVVARRRGVVRLPLDAVKGDGPTATVQLV